MDWVKRHRIHLALFGSGMLVFCLVAGGSRLARQSSDPHFVYQADAWLSGHLSIESMPPGADDPARVETVLLRDGRTVRGRRVTRAQRSGNRAVRRPFFRITGGEHVPISQIERSLGKTQYVSFPPFPAVLMLPQVAIQGPIANDVWTTIVIAALVLPLLFSLLRRLAALGHSERTVVEDLWLVGALALGSVFFFSAVQGRVWFTAHVIGVALAICYAWCSLDARHPILAGICLGLATLTRTPMAFMFPLFAFEAARISGLADAINKRNDRAELAPALRRAAILGAKFAAPVLIIAAIAMLYNHARFGEATEFGHSYLEVRQRAQIDEHGLFSYQYLARNLAVAFTLLPKFSSSAPYVSISGHGLALWITTPVLVLLLWPRRRGMLHAALWTTVALVAIPTLFYQNSGWVQFGYRFSLDYMVFLVMLLAIGGRPLTRVAKGLIIAGVVVNLFGAVTFHRSAKYYRTDNHTYQVVVPH